MAHIMLFEEFSQAKPQPINEGAGAAYDVMLGGLQIDANSVKISDKKVNKDGGEYFIWTASLKPKMAEEWATASYYDGIDDSTIHYTLDFDIKGGEVKGWQDANSFVGNNGEFDKNAATEYIKDFANVTFSLSGLIGGGYTHTNLTNPFVLGEEDYVEEWKVLESDYRKSHGYNRDDNEYGIYYAAIDAPDFVDFVNEFYKNPEYYYE